MTTIFYAATSHL